MDTCIVCAGGKFNFWSNQGRDLLCGLHREEAAASRIKQRQNISIGAKRRWDAVRRTPAQTDWRNWCIRSVARAVRNGWLPDLSSGEYACVDCSGVADRWEHRDYSLVLDVEPVCHTCNMRRGLGQMPTFTRVFARHPSAQASGESERALSNRAA